MPNGVFAIVVDELMSPANRRIPDFVRDMWLRDRFYNILDCTWVFVVLVVVWDWICSCADFPREAKAMM